MELNGPEFKLENNKITSMCIFLHGWGSDGNDLIQIAPELAKQFNNMIFLSPNAPDVCSANPLGRQWFELNEKLSLGQPQIDGVNFSSNLLLNYIKKNIIKFKVDPKNVFLFGFSQGAAMALHVGLRYDEELGGILAFSGLLMLHENMNEIKNKGPVLLVHGKEDEVVPSYHLENSNNILIKSNVFTKTILIPNLGHSINIEGIQKAKEFILSGLL